MIIRTFLFLSLSIFLVSCTSTADLGAGKTGKSIMVKGNKYDDIWNASIKSLQSEKGDQSLEIKKNIGITEQDKSRGYIKAESGLSLFSYGEVIGVFIEPANDAPSHIIEVESRSRLKTNVTANNWEDEILKSIKSQLHNK